MICFLKMWVKVVLKCTQWTKHELVLTFALFPCVLFSEWMYNTQGDLLLMLKAIKYFWQD